MVELFLDSSKIEEVKKWSHIVTGCTTNQKILAMDGCKTRGEMEKRVKEICSHVRSVSVEVFSNDAKEIVEEAKKYSEWNDKIAVKIPMTAEGLRAIKYLKHHEPDIKCNNTVICGLSQAFLAGKVGADYASIFVGRINDMPKRGMKSDDGAGFQTLEDAITMYEKEGFHTKIIAASIRSIHDVVRCIKLGVHIITVKPDILLEIVENPMTVKTIKEFLDSWEGK